MVLIKEWRGSEITRQLANYSPSSSLATIKTVLQNRFLNCTIKALTTLLEKPFNYYRYGLSDKSHKDGNNSVEHVVLGFSQVVFYGAGSQGTYRPPKG